MRKKASIGRIKVEGLLSVYFGKDWKQVQYDTRKGVEVLPGKVAGLFLLHRECKVSECMTERQVEPISDMDNMHRIVSVKKLLDDCNTTVKMVIEKETLDDTYHHVFELGGIEYDVVMDSCYSGL